MSAPLVLVVAVIYLSVAIEQLLRGSVAGFVVWASYASANLGLVWLIK